MALQWPSRHFGNSAPRMLQGANRRPVEIVPRCPPRMAIQTHIHIILRYNIIISISISIYIYIGMYIIIMIWINMVHMWIYVYRQYLHIWWSLNHFNYSWASAPDKPVVYQPFKKTCYMSNRSRLTSHIIMNTYILPSIGWKWMEYHSQNM